MTDFSDYKGIWVFCEQRGGELMPTDFELISEASRLAKEMDCKVTGVLLGNGVEAAAKTLGGYGADEVILCEDPLLEVYTTDAYTKVICDLVNEYKPAAMLIGATNIGRDLGPRCAARLHTGLTADATDNVQERCRIAGMNDCICKPIDSDKLFNCLSREMEGQADV